MAAIVIKERGVEEILMMMNQKEKEWFCYNIKDLRNCLIHQSDTFMFLLFKL